MKPLRWLAAGLLWILAGVVGLLGALLSVTIILLPLGIPLLMLARKLGGLAGVLVVPKALRHPLQEVGDRSSEQASAAGKGARRFLGKGREAVAEATPSDRTRKLAKKTSKRASKKASEMAPKALRRRRGLQRLKWWS